MTGGAKTLAQPAVAQRLSCLRSTFANAERGALGMFNAGCDGAKWLGLREILRCFVAAVTRL
jgi:hypothetical protein